MSRRDDFDRAQRLAAEAIELCDKLGQGLAAAHMQLGLDTLTAWRPKNEIREERSPWGRLEEP